MFGGRKGSKGVNQRNYSMMAIQQMIRSSAKIAPIVASEADSITVAIPTTQSQLNHVLSAMVENNKDQFGNKRLVPSTCNVLPIKKVESKGDLPRDTASLSGKYDDLTELLPQISEDGLSVSSLEEVILPLPPIFYGKHTSVFNIANDPEKVIRYHLHCQPLMTYQLDETIVDYWFLKRLESSGIVPKVYYYSAPLMSPPVGLAKTALSISERKDTLPSLRYVVMEKVGPSIHRYVSKLPYGRASFTDAIRIGGQMIGLAETLHAYSIIHGDAHLGNFAIHNGKIIMIDFGRAKIMSSSELSERHCHLKRDFSLGPRISPWEMQKYLTSYRDDIYRIIQGIAFNIYGNDYTRYMEHIYDLNAIPNEYVSEFIDYIVDLKMYGNCFDISQWDTNYRFPRDMKTSFSLDGIVEVEKIDEVKRLFKEIMQEVLKVDVFSKPDYSSIRRKLVNILNIVEETDSSDSSDPESPGCCFDLEFSTMNIISKCYTL